MAGHRPAALLAARLDFDALARAFWRCWSCTLHLREPRPAAGEPGPDTKAEGLSRPLDWRSAIEWKMGPREPLPGAREAQRRLHELWLSDHSLRVIEREMRELASRLGWPEGEVPNFISIGAHLRNHLPLPGGGPAGGPGPGPVVGSAGRVVPNPLGLGIPLPPFGQTLVPALRA